VAPDRRQIDFEPAHFYLDPGEVAQMNAAGRRAMFETMVLMRRFEEAVAAMSKEHPFGHFHLYIGQEATGAAVLAAMGDDDLALTTHRNHGHVVGRGADPARALAEILGRRDGLSGGRGGTLHLTDRTHGFLSTSAVVGGVIGLATGAAHALKRQGNGNISVAFFGDGAMEEGIAFEAFNMAALWNLPVLFVCENNTRGALASAEGGFSSSTMAIDDLADIPGALGIRSAVVDGADADAVFAAAAGLMEELRLGAGPAFIEARTERWPGSRPIWPDIASTGITDLEVAWEPARAAGEFAGWVRDHDPVLRFAARLAGDGVLGRDQILAIDGDISGRLRAAMDFAAASPWPDAESALAGTFAGGEAR
jgi:TPP-dependent pyruvate/acetoin dehydrogenase alpha subunit